MKITHRLFYWAVAVFLMACDPQTQENTASFEPPVKKHTDSLYYEFSNFSREYGNCTTDTAVYCTRIALSYPQFESEADSMGAAKINNKIQSAVLHQFSPGETETKSIDAFADQFIKDYKEIKAAFGEAFGWYANLNSAVLRNDTSVVTIELTADLYTGGAHGNVTVQYLNFDPNTGEKIDFDALFVQGYQDALNKIIEQKFRMKHDLPADRDLSDEGFQFENEQYFNKDNFALLKDGIKFYYNNYEIAPFSSGPSEVFVAYNELESIIRRKPLE